MTLYEEAFPTRKGTRQQVPPQPLLIRFDSQTVQTLPYVSPQGIINAIRVQDVARGIWYSWNKTTQYPNGYWDNAGGGGNNAPPGQTPMVTPGTGNLYIAFNAINMGSVTGTLTLKITDQNGTVLNSIAVSTASAGNAGIEWTGNMPTTPYTVTMSVTP